jgi:hypothetical protein
MILNLSKVKTQALLLFCNDLIQTYSQDENIFDIDNSIKEYINNTVVQLSKAISQVVKPQQYYEENYQTTHVKATLEAYELINENISKHLSKGAKFNPAMLCFALLTTWFAELRYESGSKEYIFFTLYPYGNIYDKLLLDMNNNDFKALNIFMIQVAEDTMLNLSNHSFIG